MSACLLAHVNTSGVHIPIWLDSEGAIGWGQNTSYPYQEGSFFGNVFVNPPEAHFCNGRDFDSATVPGRLGANVERAVHRSVRDARPVRGLLHRLVVGDQRRRRRLLHLQTATPTW